MFIRKLFKFDNCYALLLVSIFEYQSLLVSHIFNKVHKYQFNI